MRPLRPDWWVGHKQGRRPVSKWRQAIGAAFLVSAVAAFVGYRHLTAEYRLRGYAEAWLTDFSGGESHVERVEFNPFRGLHLVGVTIATPSSSGFFPPEASLEDRTVFSAATVLLRLQPFSIISGELVVPQIIAVNPKLTLVDRAADGLDNWEVMLARRKRGKPGKGPPYLPEIRLRNVEVQQYRLNDRGRVGGTVQTFYAGALPIAERPQVYDLRLTKIIPSADGQTFSGEAGRLNIDMETGAVSGSLPSLSLEELLFAAPPEINRWLDILDLRGYVRAETFLFDPKQGTQARLKLRDARLSIPVDEVEARDRAVGRYIRFSKVAGSIEFDGHAARVEMEGLFRNSPVQFKGRMTLPPEGTGGLTGIGFDLDLAASQVPLPRCDEEAGEPEKRFVRRWHRLETFVQDFDGKGNVDLSLKLHKEVGPDKGIEFVEGKLVARGVSAAFVEFPYRLDGLKGEVHFRRDGRIDLMRLTGTHGEGLAIISGELGGYTGHDSVRLEIQGRNIVLDADLLERLSADDRELCRMFLKRALLDLDIRLDRPQSDPAGPRAGWKAVVDASFLDGAFLYADFPYPLDELRGRVRIAEGTMRMEELSGRHGSTVCRVSGTADREGARAARVDVRLQAKGVRLDEDLAAALRSDVRALYERHAPTGRATIAGRLHSERSGEPLQFDLTARLTDAGLSLPGGQARLTGVDALLHIVPDRLEIKSLQGLLGPSLLKVGGRMSLSSRAPGAAMHVGSEALELDDTLRSTLPPALQETFDALMPRGQVRLDLQYRSSPAETHAPATTSAPATAGSPAPDEYRAVIEPMDCRLRLARFPLPLERVNGRIVLTPGLARFETLTGRHGPTRFEMAGQLETREGTTIIQIGSLKARDLEFTEKLRKAVPWRLRRMWNDMSPTGECDLDLRDIRVVSPPRGKKIWQATGRVDLREAGLSAGPEFTEVQAGLEGTVGSDEGLYLDARLDVGQTRVDGRLVTEGRADLHKSADSDVLQIRNILGTVYGGALLGEIDVDYAARPPSFGLSLTARNISLGEFLDAGRDEGSAPLRIKGRMQGTLALTGPFGNPAGRQGSGSVVIQDAEMLKLPLVLSILRIVHLAIDDDNAFHDALLDFIVNGDEVVLERIDLRGKAVSMVGAGRVRASDYAMHLVLLVGSPLRLPRVAVLSELVEGVARELMEVHVEGTLSQPVFRADLVRSIRKTLEAITSVQTEPSSPLSLRPRRKPRGAQ